MRGFGLTLFWVAGVLLFILEIMWFYQWWGAGGVIASVLIPPLAAIFPFIFLFKEGFNLLYFGIWGVGIAGQLLAGSAD